MKDKLTKTGKKKPYYIMKTMLVSLAFVALTFLIAAIPVGISYGIYLRSLSQAAKAAADVGKQALISLGL